MNAIDYILLAGIGLALLLAIRHIIKAKKQGKCCSCGGDCSCCKSGCHTTK